MTPSEAQTKWRDSAAAAQSGERYVLTGNMVTLAHALRWFKKDDEAEIELVSDNPKVGRFSAVIRVVPRLTKRELQPGQTWHEMQPYLLLVS